MSAQPDTRTPDLGLHAKIAAMEEALRAVLNSAVDPTRAKFALMVNLKLVRDALSPDSGNEVLERLRKFEGKANAWDAVYSEVSVLPQYQESLREYHEGGNHSAAVAFKLFIQGILAQRDTALAERDALFSNLDSDSPVAACQCGTKTPDVAHHKPGCKYRLIVERDAARVRLVELEVSK